MIYCKTKLASLTSVACFYFVVSQCGHCSSSHNDITVAVWARGEECPGKRGLKRAQEGTDQSGGCGAKSSVLLWRVLLLLLLHLQQLLFNLRPPLGFDHLDLRGQLFDSGVHRRLFRRRLR